MTDRRTYFDELDFPGACTAELAFLRTSEILSAYGFTDYDPEADEAIASIVLTLWKTGEHNFVRLVDRAASSYQRRRRIALSAIPRRTSKHH